MRSSGMRPSGLIVLLFLTSCGTIASDGAARSCPVKRDWTADEEAAIGRAFDALPADSPLIGVVLEDRMLRRESDDCWTR